MTESVGQFNISECGYLRIPYSFFKQPLFGTGSRTPTRSEIGLGGLIFGFSNRKGDAAGSCKMSYSTFEQKLHISRGTVARSIGALKRAGKIIQDKSHKTCASYRFAEKPNEKGFITVDLYFYNTKFAVRGESEARYLTQAEIQVLCLIKTHCQNTKGTGTFTGSMRGIARTLGLSKNCVQDCISALLRAELIFRPQKGLNGHERSTYKANEKLLRKLSKTYQKEAEGTPQKRLTEAERTADERTDRERFYAQRKQIALDRAEAFKARAMQDETFRTVSTELNALTPKLGMAEGLGKVELFTELKKREKQLKVQKAKRLTLLGLSEEDLQPHWHCPLCEDTGYMKDGRGCSCYSEERRRRT